MSPKDDSRGEVTADESRPRDEGRERSEDRRPAEIGGRRKGLEPTRYGEWEKDGRCIDF